MKATQKIKNDLDSLLGSNAATNALPVVGQLYLKWAEEMAAALSDPSLTRRQVTANRYASAALVAAAEQILSAGRMVQRGLLDSDPRGWPAEMSMDVLNMQTLVASMPDGDWSGAVCACCGGGSCV
jgi:hypothetical protein